MKTTIKPPVRRYREMSDAQLRAAELFYEAEAGNPRAQFQLAESISQGDLPTQLQPTIRRVLLDAFDAEPTTSERFTSKETVDQIDKDIEYDVYGFNQDNIADLNMGDTWIPGTLPRVTNREKYPQLGISASNKFLRATTLGEAFGIDWQAIVNSRGTRVDLIRDAVTQFGIHSRQTTDAEPVKKLVNASGINTAALGTTGHAITGNPKADNVLTISAAIAQAKLFKINGVTPNWGKFALVTSPENVPVVNQALTTRTITRLPARTGTDSAVTSNQYEQTIDLGGELDVVGSRWITAINPGLGAAWFLIPIGWGRPGITRNHLSGFEDPSFWVKQSNAINYGGGEVPYIDGDFDSDAIQTKVRFVFGSSLLWNEGIVYSTGAGS